MALLGLLVVLASSALRAQPDAAGRDRFPLTQGRFGTLGAPAKKQEWDLLGACWFKSGDCYWQASWVPESDVQAWLLVRPQMFFTGNNRVWNPPPKPLSWDYRDKSKRFIQENKDKIGITALGNSICYEDIESGYPNAEEYATWYHDFAAFVRGLNPRIKLAPGDLQSAWGGLHGTDLLMSYQAAYQKKYGEKMPIDAVGLHCYITGNKPPEWAKPEPVKAELFREKIRAMRAFMKRAGLQDAAFVITEMGVFNHCCDPPLTDAQLIAIMRYAIELMEGPEGVDKELGMPSDGYRLVQKWSYSAFPHLVKDGRLTPMGQAYRELADKYAKGRD
jgi:hypothetical protein